MKTEDIILLGGLAIGGYLLVQKTEEKFRAVYKPVGDILAIPKTIAAVVSIPSQLVASAIPKIITGTQGLFQFAQIGATQSKLIAGRNIALASYYYAQSTIPSKSWTERLRLLNIAKSYGWK